MHFDPNRFLIESCRVPFIVIEGIDGSGKTTQARMLAKAIGATAYSEPTNGPIGKLIREHLKGYYEYHPEVLARLFAADRLDHITKSILPSMWFSQVKNPVPPIVCDRYVASSLAYQGTQLGDMNTVWRINTEHGMLIRPHLTIYLECAPETAMQRITKRDSGPEAFDDLDKLTQISKAYDEAMVLLEIHGWDVVRVPVANRDIDTTHSSVLDIVKKTMKARHGFNF